MDIRKVSDQFSVSGQLTLDALKELQAAGIKTLICNRPDHEVPGQPAHAELDKRAMELGMQVYFLPVVHDTLSSRDVEAFATILATAPTPVHAWCRSGLRSLTLWSLAQIKAGADPAAQVAKATALGFDFKAFLSRFAQMISKF